VRHRQPRLFGQRNDLFDGIEPVLVAEARDDRRAAQVGLLAFTDTPGEYALSVRNRSRPRRSATHCASTMSEAGIVDDPIMRTLPRT